MPIVYHGRTYDKSNISGLELNRFPSRNMALWPQFVRNPYDPLSALLQTPAQRFRIVAEHGTGKIFRAHWQFQPPDVQPATKRTDPSSLSSRSGQAVVNRRGSTNRPFPDVPCTAGDSF